MTKRLITRNDILPMADYAKIRTARRAEIAALKKRRRVAVGPDANFHFENYETMWMQIHEMLFIEGGGEAQIAGELEAYNPLVPNGRELVATLMFEIDHPARRRRLLATLAGVERTAALTFAGHVVKARPEADLDRSTDDGKASAVQFLHFPFTEAEIAAFRDPATEVVLGLSHPGYAHSAAIPPEVRRALAADFAD